MYGVLIESIADFAKRNYGQGVWDMVRKKAKLEFQTFNSHQQYSETLFLKIMRALAEVTGQEHNELMESLGTEFVDYVGQFGYDRVLRVLGRHMRDFLNGLDNLHEYMKFTYQKLKPPSFFVECETANGLTLHYRSKRKGYLYYVKGQIKHVGKVFYNQDIKIDIKSENQEGDLSHVVFELHFKNDAYNQNKRSRASMTSMRNHGKALKKDLPIRSEIFFELFPFHIAFKKNMEILSVGEGLEQAMKNLEGEVIKDLFNLVRPLVTFTWDNVISHTNNIFELATIEPIRRLQTASTTEALAGGGGGSSSEDGHDECLKLKGQMLFIKEWDAIIFLATPVLENLDAMFNTGFYINDLSMHDSSRDLVLVGTQQKAELKLALDKEKQKSKAFEESMKKLDIEMKKADQLLYQMIPKKIAERIRAGEAAMNLCEVFSNVTILFSHVVDFVHIAAQITPMEVITLLNQMYTKIDKVTEAHDVYKVETIGDSYMVVSGLPERTPNHALEIMNLAFDMLGAISTMLNPSTNEPLMIRLGAHSGAVVSGVVGVKMPRYCLFGDTVNTSSRMESKSEAMKIQISATTKALLDKKPFQIVERGKIDIKGKGEMKTYFVVSKTDDNGNPIRSPYMDVYPMFKQ